MSDSDGLDSIDEIYTNPAPVVDFVKMQVGFWEKLVVLDAAVLAASFTATSMFSQHAVGDGGIGYLAAAWKLLVSGIVLSLLAQWIAILGAIATTGYYYGLRVLSLLKTRPDNRALSPEIVSRSPILRSKADRFSRLASALGSAGLLSSIAAFYWLYRFAHVNAFSWRR